MASYRQIQLHSSSHIKTIFPKWLWEAASTCKSIRNKVCQWGQSAVRLPIHSERTCLFNIGAPQHIRQTPTDIKGEIDSNTIIAGDFNTPLTPMDRSSKQKINKETQVLNDTLDEMDLIGIFRTFHPNEEEYTFFSTAHGTFSRIDYILVHKSNLNLLSVLEPNPCNTEGQLYKKTNCISISSQQTTRNWNKNANYKVAKN